MPTKRKIEETMQEGRDRINGFGFTIMLLCFGLVSGCTHTVSTGGTTKIHDIEILEQVTPRELYVNAGDEVRWNNLRLDPVKLVLLRHHRLDLVSCEKGFSRFGIVQDTATIPPNDYVSMCFSQPGMVQYNVWLSPDDPRGRMTPTANIQVSAVSTTIGHS